MLSERRVFGERLRKQRERSAVSLASISQTTKVPASLYAALERGDCSRWPAGIYGRAYVKAYAEAVGLNAAETVREFSVLFGGDAQPAVPGAPPEAPLHGGGLRLMLAEEPAFQPEVVAKRAALAGAELVIGLLIAAIVSVGFSMGTWATVAAVLAYFVAGRAVSDEPLLYWIFLRYRSHGTPEPAAEDVPVADAASTTA